MNDLVITLPELHDAQWEIAEHPARFKVVNCGRRFGKTELGIDTVVRVALRGGFAWWVGPTYPIAAIGWEGLKRYARQLPPGLCAVKEQDKTVTFPGGGTVQVKSADNPDSLRGRGLDYVVLDEAAYIPERAWTEALRPALSDRQGGALFISTPAGRNWFYRLYNRGLADGTEWASWWYPTSANPYIVTSEIEAARAELPVEVFAQEYEAAFTDDAGMVFRNVRECIRESMEPSGRTFAGVDWGQSKDFTAIAVIDEAGQLVAPVDRFNAIGWAVQRDRVTAALDRWQVSDALVELNSIGGPNFEELANAGLPVHGFTTTNETKARIIQQLVGAFERGEISIPNDPVLIGELEAYEAKRLPSGKWQYSAPDGMHDDTVIALALAWEARLAEGRYTVNLSSNPFFGG